MDKQSQDLAQKHRVDVVMSSSSLTTLICNIPPSYPHQWEIPVTVTTSVSPTPTPGGETNWKTVYIDKKLIPKRMTLREKNEIYYNLVLEHLSLQTQNFKVFQQTQQETQQPQPEFESELENENLTYNLWKFGDIRILVRCKIHGFISTTTPTPGFRYIGVKPKLEYLSTIGWEEISIGETANEWIYTYLRPDAHLVLGRIDVKDSKLLQMEYKDMPSILPSGCLFKPGHSAKIVFVLLQKLLTLPEGRYLISHNPKDENILIYRSTSSPPLQLDNVAMDCAKDFDYDLHNAYQNSGMTDTETIPYIPTKWIHQPNQIPYTYPLNPNLNSKAYKLQYGHIHHCFSFALTGTCPQTGNCQFPHLTRNEVENFVAAKPKKKKPKKKKKKEMSTSTSSKTLTPTMSTSTSTSTSNPKLPVLNSKKNPETTASENLDWSEQLALYIATKKRKRDCLS